MFDKPTIKEYLSRNMRYVKTRDGRYYAVITHKKTFIIMMIMLGVYAVVFSISMFADVPWRDGISSDILWVMIVISYIVQFVRYRFEKFSLLEEGSVQYMNASDKPYMQHGWVITLVTMSLLFIMNITGSYSLAYLRSLLDTPMAEWRMEHEETNTFLTLHTSDCDTVIEMPAEMHGFVTLRLDVLRSPEVPQLRLDEETLKVRDRYQSVGYWVESDYLQQTYYYKFLAKAFHDGSVLTLTCGKWQYEWEFDIEDL